MDIIKTLYIIFAILTLQSNAHALVDPSTGSYSEVWVDSPEDHASHGFSLNRSFNSRARNHGWWGIGWCSSLDRKLELFHENAQLKLCGDINKISFERAGGNIWRTKSDESGSWTLVEKLDRWTARKNDGEAYEFDSAGRLAAVISPQLVRTELIWKGEVLTAAKLQNGQLIKFSFNSDQRLTEINWNENARTSYSYENGLLKKVQYPQIGVQTIFEYDAAKNLRQLTFQSPQKANGEGVTTSTSKIGLTYNERNWITSITNSKGCVDTLDYNQLNQMTHKILHTQICNGVQKKSEHSIKRASNGGLMEVTIYRPQEGTSESVKYNLMGQILEHVKPNHIETRSYHPDGRLAELKLNSERVRYTYDKKTGKPAKIIRSSADGRAPASLRAEIQIFKYDERGRVSSSTIGQETIKVTYDKNDRPLTIEDPKTKHIVTYTYTKNFNTPEKIHSNLLGTLTYRYDQSGNFKEVTANKPLAYRISANLTRWNTWLSASEMAGTK